MAAQCVFKLEGNYRSRLTALEYDMSRPRYEAWKLRKDWASGVVFSPVSVYLSTTLLQGLVRIVR